jgi:molybdopterin-guanine dinucleotide biosynthesis protein A
MILGSIVLAGGSSSRMGSPKESLPWGDGSLLLHTVETLLDCTYPVVVVARDDHQDLPPLHTECELIFDDKPGEGLRFVESRCDAVLVVGCDLPFLNGEAVAWLAGQLGDHSGVVPVLDGIAQPLCGIYHVRLRPTIRDLVHRGERRALALAGLPGVHKLPEDLIRRFDPELRFLRDVDTPDEFDAARRDAGQA